MISYGDVNKNTNFYHYGSNGDIIYSLPTVISYLGKNEKAILYLRKENQHRNLHDLLKLQPYIKDALFLGHKGNLHNLKSYIDLSTDPRYVALHEKNQHLAVTYLKVHKKSYDLSQAWLTGVEPLHVADIIIHRTPRYRGELNWDVLKSFADKCKFIGLQDDVDSFKLLGLNIEHYKTKNALEMASVIKGSKLFIGNQSLGFALAESMKHPRCLEVCNYFNNCQPHGSDGYTELSEELVLKCLDPHNQI